MRIFHHIFRYFHPFVELRFFYLSMIFLLWPRFAFAAPTDVLKNALDYLTGPLGKVVAALAVAVVGYTCFVLGRLPKSYMFATLTGIAIIFGTQAILVMLGVAE